MGGGISNTQVVTEEGKYALDAVQNNPNVPGSLRNRINNTAAKVDTCIVNAWNDFEQTAQQGYINLAKIKIVTTYANYPLKFTVNGRGFPQPVNLIVLFRGTADTDPGIDKYILKPGFSNAYNNKFYIAKTAAGTWNIYASHPSYASIVITMAEIFKAKSRTWFEVTYPNNLVDSLPSGSLEFTVE